MILYYLLLFLIITILVILNSKLEFISNKISIYDSPDKLRKFHKRPTPVIGWIYSLIVMTCLLFFSFVDKDNIIYKPYLFEIYNEEHIRAYISLFVGAFSVFFIGVYDDKNNISATKKSFILVGILYLIINFDKTLIPKEIYFYYFDYIVYLENFAIPFTILSIFFLINSLNLYDGTNLQSGFFLSFVYIVFIYKGIFPEFFLIFFISNLFFIYKNYNGKLFFGDAGIFLNSYIISYFVLKSYNYNFLSTDLIMIIFFLPAIDLIRLFIIRLIFLKNPFIGDRNHFHHILALLFDENLLKINLVLLIICSLPIIFYDILNISLIISFIPSLLFYFSFVIYFYIYKKKMLQNLNKYKLIFSFLFIVASMSYCIKLYNNQNFQEFTKISVTYNNVPFQSHRNFIKTFRNLDNYDFWLKNKNPTAEIIEFVEEGVYSNEDGYSKNKKLVFPDLRETDATYFVIIKKTSNENLKNIKEYLEFTADQIEDKFKKNYAFYNISISLPSEYYKKNFNPIHYFIIAGLILNLFAISILLFLYEEIKALNLFK